MLRTGGESLRRKVAASILVLLEHGRVYQLQAEKSFLHVKRIVLKVAPLSTTSR